MHSLTASTGQPESHPPVDGDVAGRRHNGFILEGISPIMALALTLATAIFICDWHVELGVATGVAYVIVVWVAAVTNRGKPIFIAAILCSGLTIIGFLISPESAHPWKVLANRGLALMVIWLTVFFVLQRQRAEHAQRKLNDDLTALNEALTQSNMDLQQFAYIASHDLQAPLRHISGFVQLLQNAYKGKLDEQADLWIGFTVDGVERMQNLIRDLLTFSRVESRSRAFEHVPLREVFDETVELLAASIAETGAAVTCDDLPTVTGDASQMVHLMQNLIGNAIKYHGDIPPEVHVSAEHSGDEWVISVRDNGIGIEPRHYERIFEIFRRLHTNQDYPGTGIGLAVCRRIVQRHGGRIWLESDAGEGATFHFTIAERTKQT